MSTVFASGHLHRNPYRTRAAPGVALNLPKTRLDDYPEAARFERNDAVPVFVSYTQFYDMMDNILVHAREFFPDLAMALVEMRQPYVRPMPPRMLDGDVLVAADVEHEWRYWTLRGGALTLAVRSLVRRDHTDLGDNSMRWMFDGDTCSEPQVRDFLAGLDFWSGFVLDDIRLCDNEDAIRAFWKE